MDDEILLSKADRIRRVDRYQDQIENLDKLPIRRDDDEEEHSGRDDQRYVPRDIFEARKSYKIKQATSNARRKVSGGSR